MNTPEQVTWADNEMRRILQSISPAVADGIIARLKTPGGYHDEKHFREFGLGYAPQPANEPLKPETQLETTAKALIYHAEICNFDMGRRSVKTFVDALKLALK